MKLSAPIHVLRQQAKALKTETQTSLVVAQNQIAKREGFQSWSQLMAHQKDHLPTSMRELGDYFNEGDLVLLGARPRLGKVRVAASLIASAALNREPKSYFFTFAEREVTIRSKIEGLLEDSTTIDEVVDIDCSDHICASLIIENLTNKQIEGALIVVDYLQALDEKRIHPTLQQQIADLKEFAKLTRCKILFIAQLDRQVDEQPNQAPTETDVRLPNPLDLRAFNKTLFLYRPKHSGNTEDASLVIQRPRSHQFAISQAELGLG